jgi:hypothetical protein
MLKFLYLKGLTNIIRRHAFRVHLIFRFFFLRESIFKFRLTHSQFPNDLIKNLSRTFLSVYRSFWNDKCSENSDHEAKRSP